MKRFYALFSLLILAASANGQERLLPDSLFTDFSQLLSPENVYLHTDREVYNIGDTVWLKGYLTNASADAAYPECNSLSVELFAPTWGRNPYTHKYDSFSQIQNRVKLKRQEDGSFSGYIPLVEDINTGIATVRAYSYWQLNGRRNTCSIRISSCAIR